ncbi:PilZ domain-containing protein [Aurantiacibacter aquimixticola]|uniref:PilZ domain-containing protein n=1 Tax=Aurantiacibacter aquimixticola TaxID=1958945 RepID=A0A419RSM0_9SPHN|nr:PilZ domain-containing protein [Aurantiacibacter aquimixticola]RJY08776.1 hypothetical protein D6201_04850 [Aurantiacibacter aquimixticola]
MSVLTIRAHRRYALRTPAQLKRTGRKAAKCLLIELSQQGARLSNLGQSEFLAGDIVTLVTDCGKALEGTIRWAHDGRAGVTLNRAMHMPEMSALIDASRKDMVAA